MAADRRANPGGIFSQRWTGLRRSRCLSFVHRRPQREFLEGVLGDLNQMLAQFIRAQLTLAALSFVAYLAFMELTRVPYALVLGTAGGMMEFIPVVGPLVAAVLILAVAMLMSYPHWLAAADFSGAWRLVQDYVISPRVMGQSMELHPLAAIFGVLAGRRDRRSAWHLSFHSHHGQPAHRVAALAPLCREEAVWAAERILVRIRDHTPDVTRVPHCHPEQREG